MDQSKFELGQIVATPGCLAAVAGAGQTIDEFLVRHQNGDWSDVSSDDATRNDEALLDGSRLLSTYQLKSNVTIWLLTEAVDDEGKRASTCVLLPEEY